MGIKKFSTVFPPLREIKYKNLINKHIAIDARAEIYRAALGMKLSDNLTDQNGNPTIHINAILLGVILKLKAAGARQYWVFDYEQKIDENEHFHVQLKELEIAKRRKKREDANEKLRILHAEKEKLEQNVAIFSDSDEETIGAELKECCNKIEKQKKQAFSLHKFYTDDVIFMLDMLDIPWVIAPKGYEAEQICAISTQNASIFGVLIDYVLSPDADVLPFGALKVIKRDMRKKKLFEYDLNELLSEHSITQDDLIKISLILGWESVPKTPRIGVKTVLAKFAEVKLSEEQLKAFEFFKKKISEQEIAAIIIHNRDAEAFTDKNKYLQLLDWLHLNKCFNRDRIDRQFTKNGLFVT